jgi:hypothetical protein
MEWLAWAERRSAKLQLSLDQLLNALALVRSVLGGEWLEREERKATIADFHPLYRLFRSATDEALVEVCELARYLEGFKDDAALPAVIADLRSAKYPSTFFELCTGYRWKRAGAQVALQPKTPRGVADFAATFEGLPFIVECSVVPHDFFAQPAFRLAPMIKDSLRDALTETPLAAKLAIKEFAGDWQGEMKKAAKHLAREIELSGDSRGVATHECEAWSFSLERITEYTEQPGHPDWDLSFRISHVPTSPADLMVSPIPDDLRHERMRVFIRLPAKEKTSTEQILKKFDREERQLRGVAGPRVVILEIRGLTHDVLDFPDVAEIGPALHRAMRSTPELACVWLTTRGWSTALRFQCRSAFIPNAESTYQLPYSFLDRLLRQEQTVDFLTDSALPVLTRDEAFAEYQRRSARS